VGKDGVRMKVRTRFGVGGAKKKETKKICKKQCLAKRVHKREESLLMSSDAGIGLEGARQIR